MSRWVWLLSMISSLAFAQASQPSVVPAPLELGAHPTLRKYEVELRAAFVDVLRQTDGVLMPTRREAELYFSQLKRTDCRDSDECLAQLATQAHSLYAVWVELTYSELKVVTVTARVVRSDGKRVANATTSAERGKSQVVDACRAQLRKVIDELHLPLLPNTKEVVTAPPSPPEKKEPTRVEPPPPLEVKVSPPPPPTLDEGHGQRTAGQVVLISGAGVALVGGALLATGRGIGGGLGVQNGNLPTENVGSFRTAQALSGAGVGVLIGGAVVALVGGVTWLAAPSAPVHVALTPLKDGALVGFAGDLP